MRFSRGQLSWAEPVWTKPTAHGGYAINLEDKALIGATHDRLDGRNPFELRTEDDDKNLSDLAKISGQNIRAINRKSRASVRVTTANTLPLLAGLGGNFWALTGLGSRGFTFAPLLAEALIADLCNEIGPLDKNLRAKFSAPR
jgi:tRNA 5-methylaminomethyl-2-thiouridine biosynthesis bifunctional protein